MEVNNQLQDPAAFTPGKNPLDRRLPWGPSGPVITSHDLCVGLQYCRNAFWQRPIQCALSDHTWTKPIDERSQVRR